MRLLFLSAFAVALTSTMAHAYPAKETEILSTTSYAVATAGQKNRKGAEAYCRQAEKTVTKKPEEAYLGAHIERCFALVADTAGDKATACKRFKKALDIWKRTPPPNDHPQSVASRTILRTSMEQYRATNCTR
jgi:gamma-glutamyl:cysteine ligase YbdK (ATP-grasp superfamily)